MGFWIFMLFMDLLIPLTMIGGGALFLTRPPKNINAIYGYRTIMSMKNKDTWDFAHKFCGRLYLRWGLALLPTSIIPLLFVLGKNENTIAIVGLIVCFIHLIFFIGAISPVEAALKKTFDKDGNRR